MGEYFNVDLDKLAPGQLIEPQRRGVIIVRVDEEKDLMLFAVCNMLGQKVNYLTDQLFGLSRAEFAEMLKRMGVVEQVADADGVYANHAPVIEQAVIEKHQGVLHVLHHPPF